MVCDFRIDTPTSPSIQLFQLHFIIIFFYFYRFASYFDFDVPREERLKKEGFVLLPTLLHPKSVGEIKLKSTNPLEPPAINPHYLEDHRDVKVLIQV